MTTFETGLDIMPGITISWHELEITTSRSSGAGGQHVNKTNTKITVRWNVPSTTALNDEQKARVMAKLQSRLTSEGDLIISNSESRSQHHNKELALKRLQKEIIKALHVAKKRRPTKMSQTAKEQRLESKSRRSDVKKMRKVRSDDY